MEIEVLQENLVKVLAWVNRFVESKPTIPVMAMVKIESGKDGVRVLANNLETSVEVGLGAKVVSEGSVVVPGKLLLEYVSSLPAGKMKLRSIEEQLELVCGRSKAKIEGMKVEEFSGSPEIKKGEVVKLDLESAEKIVRLVSFAAASEPVRPVLSGILFKVSEKGKLQAVSTDGYRLSVLKNVEIGYEGEGFEFILPAKVFVDVVKLVGDSGGDRVNINLAEEARSVVIKAGKLRVVCQMVEGDFPAFERILPKSKEVVIEVDKEELRDVVKVASVFARDNSHIVKWKIEEKLLRVSAAAVNVGEQKGEIEVVVKQGEEGEIAFNSKFLVELFGNIGGEKVVFSMTGGLEPGLFEGVDKGFLHVIMPVRTQEV